MVKLGGEVVVAIVRDTRGDDALVWAVLLVHGAVEF